MAKWVTWMKNADFNGIAKQFGIDPVIARVIRNKDIVDMDGIDAYLNGTESLLYDAVLLKQVETACELIIGAIHEQIPIRIIGDYDVDGICATYILFKGLEFCGADVDYAIPHRVHDGYGLNEHLVDECIKDGRKFIITCDNGIAAYDQILKAKEQGIGVIVTDHHEVPYKEVQGQKEFILPPADAIVNPKQPGETYPFTEICGAVVAWKLLHCLFYKMECNPQKAKCLLEDLSEEAALATISDMMPLRDENRIIVKYGLRRLAQTNNVGIKALLQKLSLWGEPLFSHHVGFRIGPCLNATGRLDTARKAMELLCCDSETQAILLATELYQLNEERKEMTELGVSKAVEQVEMKHMEEDSVLLLYLPDVHESIAGIIASRIKDLYYKPTIILTDGEACAKGSGRSIDGYHMFEQLSACKELLVKYGGHKMAAGLSIEYDKIDLLRDSLNENSNLTKETLERTTYIDVIMPLSYVTIPLVQQLALLEPFGNGNTKPHFACRNVRFLSGMIIGKNKNVGKFKVEDEQGNRFELICFSDLERFHSFLDERFGMESRLALYDWKYREEIGADLSNLVCHILYYPGINEYQGIQSIQFVMSDFM